MLVKAKRHSQLSYSHLFLSPFYLSYHHDFLPPLTYFRTSLLPSMFPSALRCCLYPSHLFHLSSIFLPSPASFKLPCSHCFKLPPLNTCLVSLCGFFFLLVDLTTHLRQSISICFSVQLVQLIHLRFQRDSLLCSMLHLYSIPPSIIFTQPFNRHNKEFNHLSYYLNTW